MTVTRYKNLEVLQGGTRICTDLWVDDALGVFLDPMDRFYRASDWEDFTTDRVVDCAGLLAAPGFVDIQFNGAFGVDLSSPSLTVQQVLHVANLLTATGVTAFYPTVISCAKQEYEHILKTIRAAMETQQQQAPIVGAKLLGIHLEGPYFSKERIGAHNPVYIQHPDMQAMDAAEALKQTYGELEGVKLVTLAPELKGIDMVIRELRNRGILVSMGHCSAKFSDGKVGFGKCGVYASVLVVAA